MNQSSKISIFEIQPLNLIQSFRRMFMLPLMLCIFSVVAALIVALVSHDMWMSLESGFYLLTLVVSIYIILSLSLFVFRFGLKIDDTSVSYYSIKTLYSWKSIPFDGVKFFNIYNPTSGGTRASIPHYILTLFDASRKKILTTGFGSTGEGEVASCLTNAGLIQTEYAFGAYMYWLKFILGIIIFALIAYAI